MKKKKKLQFIGAEHHFHALFVQCAVFDNDNYNTLATGTLAFTSQRQILTPNAVSS